MTEAMMVALTPWDRVSSLFNMAMMLTLYMGVITFQIDALWLYWISRDKAWLGIRYLLLAMCWVAVLDYYGVI